MRSYAADRERVCLGESVCHVEASVLDSEFLPILSYAADL
jgi:hypothetical protein